ncbi:hypothetical protein HWV62_16204 [Athelia sp. TMB]|nr:hypothetical protein HWV62_16204 [Athelia sp. TMB]
MGISQCQECGTDISYDFKISLPDSPAPDLLDSTVFLDPFAAPLIQDHLAHARGTLSSVNLEIANISKSLKYLHEKRDALEHTISRHARLLSPIQRLPEDILAVILFLAVPESPYISPSSRPLAYSQVCKAWKQCAWSCQRIWASFGVLGKETRPSPPLIRAWLSHARSIPLSPRFELDARPSVARLAWPAIAEVIAYCDRWEKLGISSPTGVLQRFQRVQGRLPLLEHLSIKIYPGEMKKEIGAFKLAPRLRSVRLDSREPLSKIRLPWGQLTDLELEIESTQPDSPDMEDSLLHIFRELASLACLTLRYFAQDRGHRHDIPPVTLPQLRTLVVSLPKMRGRIFNMIRCPNLTSISISQASVSWTCQSFLSFLGTLSSLKNLAAISLTPLANPQEIPDLVPSLNEVSTVTALRIQLIRADIPDRLLKSMTHTPEGPNLLPNLQELDMDSTVNGNLFSDMVLSRISPDRGLAQLQRVGHPKTRNGDLPLVSRLSPAIFRSK